MPLSGSNKALPKLWPTSLRKRKESSRSIGNADPLLPKNKKSKPSIKKTLAHHDTDVPTPPSPSTQKSSVDIQEVEDDGDSIVPNVHPNDPAQILELSDGSDDGEDKALVGDSGEEHEESAESELSKPATMLFYHCLKHS